MKSTMRTFALVTAVATLVATFAPALVAQDLHPSRRPSPMGMARITLDDTYIRVVYSRPYERGRENIFGTEESGALVPFDTLWRTGANEATEITVTDDVLVGGELLPAGTYSLFTTPGEEEWTIHFNSELGLSGPGRFNMETREFEPIDVEETDVLVVSVAPANVEEAVEQFTISFESTGDASADMVLRWINTEVRVPFSVADA